MPHVELIHSVASESALRQLETPRRRRRPRSCSRSTSPGEEGKAGIAPDELPRYLERSPGQGRGADDDAAVRRGSGGQPAAFRPPARARAASTGCTQLSMGTSQDYAVAAAEGATIVRIGTTLYT